MDKITNTKLNFVENEKIFFVESIKALQLKTQR